jgi:glutathione peroxidase
MEGTCQSDIGAHLKVVHLISQIDVNGKDAAPLYKYLKSQKGGFLGDGIKWNFTKFLVDKDGKVVERYAPTTSPLKIEVCFST